MQAIRTRYYGPTNTKASCIRAKCAAGAVTKPYDHALNLEANHEAAKNSLVNKLGWKEQSMIPGDFEGDTYWVFAG